MTIANGQQVQLPTPHFIGWTRSAGVRLPFPLNTREQEYVDTPGPDELRRVLAPDRLDESPVLEAARKAFESPALIVYAVRSAGDEPGSPESKYVAVTGREPNSSVVVVLDTERTSVRQVAETELAASVASAVPAAPTPAFAAFESTVETMSEVEDMCLSDASVRTKRAAMNAAGLPRDFVAMREAMLGTPRSTFGLLSAVSYAEPEGRPATRAATWVESATGAYLQTTATPRGAHTPVLTSPVTPEFLFRAAAAAISSCFS